MSLHPQAVTNVFGIRPAVPHLPPALQMSATCLHPTSGLLLVPSHNAVLQLFDPAHNRHVALHQVSTGEPQGFILSNQVQGVEVGLVCGDEKVCTR